MNSTVSLLKLAAGGIAATSMALMSGCAMQPAASTSVTAKPQTYVLVHGAFQDQRAWSEIKPRLEAAGHKVIAVQLVGRGNDQTPIEKITLDTYRDQVAAIVSAQPKPVVLVGHSFGGITISNVAEAMPDRVKQLVYVAAYLPQAGAPDQSMAKLAEQDKWNAFNKTRQNFILSKDYKTASVLEEDIVSIFCNDCNAADQARTLRDFHQREPLAPAATPVNLTAARYGRVAKTYVKTMQDRAISPELQANMLARTEVRDVVSIDAGHTPFFTQVEKLTRVLLNIN